MHQINNKQKSNKLILAIILNILITIGQVIGGIFSGSISLISDALHNFSDVMALVTSYVATKLVRKKNTSKRTYGFQRAEIIAAFINASSLIAIAIFLCFEAVRRFSEPVEIESQWVIIFAGMSILLNGLSVLILHSEAGKSMNIRSAYIHLMSDMFTSVAVLVGGLIMANYQLYWVDGALTLLIAVYLIYSTWSILMESLKVLMLFVPSHIDLAEISDRICAIREVNNIHHVHTWAMNEHTIHFEAHISFKKNHSLEEITLTLEQIREILLKDFKIDHVTLQPELDACQKQELVSQSH